jgi:hypothetical protein
MSKGLKPFTIGKVRENLIVNRAGDIRPRPFKCGRIAVRLNRIYDRENFAVCDWPHFLRGTITDHPHSKRWKRWHRYAPAMAEAVRVQLERANPDKKPGYFGYSPDGPIVNFLVKMIPLIADEHPNAEAIARELQRQQKRLPKK